MSLRNDEVVFDPRDNLSNNERCVQYLHIFKHTFAIDFRARLLNSKIFPCTQSLEGTVGAFRESVTARFARPWHGAETRVGTFRKLPEISVGNLRVFWPRAV